MPLLNTYFGILKALVLIILIVAIAIPLRYGSTNRQYLQLRLLHSILSLKHSVTPDQRQPALSADYRAFENILQMKPIADQDPLADPAIKIQKLRSTFNLNTIIPRPSECTIIKEIFEHDGHSVNTYWINYHNRKFEAKSDRLLIYLHGGGYILGDIENYSGIECHFSQVFDISILHVEYRLSPEHPLPAAVEDTIAIYRTLLKQNISPSQLLIMGDSAGGGLTLLTVQALITHQLPVPRGVIAISSWTDLSVSGDSYIRNQKADVMLNTDTTRWGVAQVLGSDQSELPVSDPSVSPLFGSFEGFPPMYVTVGTAEILEDDSRGVVKKAQAAGINVTFEEGLHMMHDYPLFFTYFPEARNSLDNINKWIQTVFN